MCKKQYMGWALMTSNLAEISDNPAETPSIQQHFYGFRLFQLFWRTQGDYWCTPTRSKQCCGIIGRPRIKQEKKRVHLRSKITFHFFLSIWSEGREFLGKGSSSRFMCDKTSPISIWMAAMIMQVLQFLINIPSAQIKFQLRRISLAPVTNRIAFSWKLNGTT